MPNMNEIQDLMRFINCLGYAEFNDIFKDRAEHLRYKLNTTFQGDIAKWIMYLDSSNLRLLGLGYKISRLRIKLAE